MLVLSRRKAQRIVIAEGVIRITVIDMEPGRVRLGIEAPQGVRVDREEIARRRESQRRIEEFAKFHQEHANG